MADRRISTDTLTGIADAIREKTGDTTPMTPSEMIDAIGSISGGGDTLGDFLSGNLGDYTNEEITTILPYTFYRYSGGMRDMRFPNVTSIGVSAFYLVALTSIFAPKAILTGDSAFTGCSALTTAILGAPNYKAEGFRKYTSMALTTVEFALTGTSGNQPRFGNKFFQGCTELKTLILRAPVIYSFSYLEVLESTPFASGGTGGTIYIPKSLYDHLGDGTSLDYKAATNWSTIDAYGTITWAKIEGSIYETQYADGTPIPSE